MPRRPNIWGKFKRGRICGHEREPMTDIRQHTTTREHPLNDTFSGWLMLGVVIFLFIIGGLTVEFIVGVPVLIVAGIMCIGFLVLKPNESAVLTLFGRYIGTVRRDGF